MDGNVQSAARRRGRTAGALSAGVLIEWTEGLTMRSENLTQRHRHTETWHPRSLCASVPLCEVCMVFTVYALFGLLVAVTWAQDASPAVASSSVAATQQSWPVYRGDAQAR